MIYQNLKELENRQNIIERLMIETRMNLKELSLSVGKYRQYFSNFRSGKIKFIEPEIMNRIYALDISTRLYRKFEKYLPKTEQKETKEKEENDCVVTFYDNTKWEQYKRFDQGQTPMKLEEGKTYYFTLQQFEKDDDEEIYFHCIKEYKNHYYGIINGHAECINKCDLVGSHFFEEKVCFDSFLSTTKEKELLYIP